MIIFLRALFIVIVAAMLAVTSWASFQCPLFAVPPEVLGHPWFIATLADAYWGFVTFYVWVCFKQTNWVAKIAWFVAILLLGNIAMALYCLDELFRFPRTAAVAEILVTRRSSFGGFGIALAAVGIAVLVLA